MSDTPFNPVPRYRKVESAMDLLDPGQHFQGDLPSKAEQEHAVGAAKVEEAQKIESERLASEKKKLEAIRKQRRESAARKGRKASIMTGPLGDTGVASVRRPMLGSGQ